MKLNSKHLFTATVALTLASQATYAAKMYKWVDKNGVVSYQDQPPPKDAKVLSEKDVKSSAASSSDSGQAAGLPKVVIYTVEDCSVCEYFVTMMKQSQVPHIELPLQSDREAQSKILAAVDSLRAPTLFIGDEIVQTSSGPELRKALTAAGYKFEEDKDTAK